MSGMQGFRDQILSKQYSNRKNLFLVQRRIEILTELGFEEEDLSVLKDRARMLSKVRD